MKGVPVHLCYRARVVNERMAFLAGPSLFVRQLGALCTARGLFTARILSLARRVAPPKPTSRHPNVLSPSLLIPSRRWILGSNHVRLLAVGGGAIFPPAGNRLSGFEPAGAITIALIVRARPYATVCTSSYYNSQRARAAPCRKYMRLKGSNACAGDVSEWLSRDERDEYSVYPYKSRRAAVTSGDREEFHLTIPSLAATAGGTSDAYNCRGRRIHPAYSTTFASSHMRRSQ